MNVQISSPRPGHDGSVPIIVASNEPNEGIERRDVLPHWFENPGPGLSQMYGLYRPSAVLDPTLSEGSLFAATHMYHDGTYAHETEMIHALSQAIDSIIPKSEYGWVISPVVIYTYITVRDMPYGKNRMVVDATGVVMAIRRLQLTQQRT